MDDWSFNGDRWWYVYLKEKEMNIKERVIEIIARTLNVENATITMDMAAGDIEQWDSMGNVAILSAIEEEFAVDFPMDELFELNTVESIVNKVIELKNV